jgi:DNA-binding NarL/FixJ family response regulator
VKLRIVIAEDSVLFREGLIRLVTEVGHEVIDAVGDAEALVQVVASQVPDLAIVDVRMPPTMTDLLKDRVLRVDEFADAAERVAGGGSALDPSVVAALVAPRRRDDRFESLSARELEVLELLAEGLTNLGVASRLSVANRTVEAHVRSIFQKLQIPDTGDNHRRVLAVVTFLSR